MAYEADRILFNSRELISKIFNIYNSKNIIFTSHATEAINLALKGLLKPGDHVITSSIDHNAVIRPLVYLEKRGVTHTTVQCSISGELDPSDIKRAINKNTRLIAVTHASNVIGTITPIKEIGIIAHENDILFLVDAAQTAGSIPIDVRENRISMLACTGHKGLLGPQGTGFLYILEGINIDPLIEGGTGSASESDSQPDYLPDKFQSGTLNIPGIAGLSAGIDVILRKGISNIREHEIKIAERLLSGLKSINKLKLYGSTESSHRTPVISFTINDIDPAYIGRVLSDKYGIMCRVGLHCAPHAHKTIGTFPQGTVRLSPGFFNTMDEADYVIDSISSIH